jgi:hypothetical protein
VAVVVHVTVVFRKTEEAKMALHTAGAVVAANHMKFVFEFLVHFYPRSIEGYLVVFGNEEASNRVRTALNPVFHIVVKDGSRCQHTCPDFVGFGTGYTRFDADHMD